MKPLTLEETRLKEQMKERCLAKGQYIDENAKAKFDMLCHLEDFEVQYWELQQDNAELKKKLEEYKEEKQEWINLLDMFKNQQKEFIKYMNDIIKELESEDVDDEELRGYIIQRIDTFKEILSKYRSIIGGNYDNNTTL